MKKIIALLSMLAITPAYADSTIDALSAASALTGSEFVPIFQGSNPAVRASTSAISSAAALNGDVVKAANSQTTLLSVGRRTLPTTQVFITGSGTYTTPANALWLEIKFVGAGGGGAGGGATATGGAVGGNTSMTGLATANGGGGAPTGVGVNAGLGGQGNTSTGGYLNIAGTDGEGGRIAQTTAANNSIGGSGGSSCIGGGSTGGTGISAGFAGKTNSGAGGGGGGATNAVNSITGGGGASGACTSMIVNTPSASYPFSIGVGGAAGAAGTTGTAGGAGANGVITVVEHYN
jgi:hypothetical protein